MQFLPGIFSRPKASKESSKTADPNGVRALSAIAKSQQLSSRGNLKAAADLLVKTRTKLEQVGAQPVFLACVMLELTSIDMSMGFDPKNEEWHKTSLKLSRQVYGNYSTPVMVQLVMSFLSLSKNGRREEGEQLLIEAQKIAADFNLYEAEIEILLLLIIINLKRNELDIAAVRRERVFKLEELNEKDGELERARKVERVSNDTVHPFIEAFCGVRPLAPFEDLLPKVTSGGSRCTAYDFLDSCRQVF